MAYIAAFTDVDIPAVQFQRRIRFHTADGWYVGFNKKRRDHLVHLWSQAAIPLRHIDLELAEICQYKSRYWLEPSNWRNEDVENFGIALEIVRDRYHALLQPRGLL